MKYNFPSSVSKMLSDAGWYEGRRTGLTEVEYALNAAGLDLFPAAAEFLCEFNELDLRLPSGSVLHLNSLMALDILWEDKNDFEQISCLDGLTGKKLCPVGWDGRSIHLISVDLEFISLWDWLSIVVNKNFREAMIKNFEKSYSISDFIMLEPEQIPPSWR